MSFVHEHQVVALKAVYGHRLVAVGISQFVDVDDLHGLLTSEQTSLSLLGEQIGMESRSI